MKALYDAGSFGVTTNIKYVMPEATHAGGVWYSSTKTSGCGGTDDCAYELATITTSGDQLKAVIDAEKTAKSWTDSSKIYLGGYSQGGQISSYVQIAKMTEKLGGVIVFCGYPLPPLTNMPGQTTAAAQAAATYYGTDMRWMFIFGSADTIFPATETQTLFRNILTKLGAASTIKIDHIEQGNGHIVSSNGLANMVRFINGADTYDSSTEVAGLGGDEKNTKGGDTKDGGDNKDSDDGWCEWFGTCEETKTEEKVDDGSPSWYKDASDYDTDPAGARALLGSVVSTLFLAALEYF